ncbi:TolB family protein [Kineococcus sp. SYSU DK018]|uniref:TolB family protein n=1 Tax=Kineococcus sp. SYSU DK018 TaxID=3383139 RepID=UPI003D7DCCF9
MKRFLTTLAAGAAAAAAVVVGTTTGAAAQHPGPNGPIASISDGTDFRAPCLNGYPYDHDDDWTPFDQMPEGGGAFSASGRYYAFSGWNPEMGTNLYVVDTVNCYPPRAIGAAAGDLAWSPDGKQLAISRGGDVYVVSPQTGATIRRLTNTPSTLESGLSWHPGGGRIAYGVVEDGWSVVRTVAPTGGSSKVLVRDATDPDYHPGGKRIAYVRTADSRIATADAVTGGGVSITPITAGGNMTYSPDGTRFAFRSAVTGDDCVVVTTSGRVVERYGYSGCWTFAWGRKP